MLALLLILCTLVSSLECHHCKMTLIQMMPAINPNWTFQATTNWFPAAFLCHPACWLFDRISRWLMGGY